MRNKLNNIIVDNRIKNRPIIRLDNYIDFGTKINWKCLVCDYVWGSTPRNLLAGHKRGCPRCGKSMQLTDTIVDQRLNNRKIKRLSRIINSITKSIFQCLVCNFIWESVVNSILRGRGCARCSKKLKLTEKVVDEKLTNKNIKRLSGFNSTKSKTNFECLICNVRWITTLTSVIHKSGCPNCSAGKNEKLVYSTLNENNIISEHQKWIKDIVNSESRRIKVDFYLQEINTIIEYNGGQHYSPVKFFGSTTQEEAELNFIKQQDRDKYLQKICDANNINLILIDGRKYTNSKLKDYLLNDIIPKLNKEYTKCHI